MQFCWIGTCSKDSESESDLELGHKVTCSLQSCPFFLLFAITFMQLLHLRFILIFVFSLNFNLVYADHGAPIR